MNAICLIIDRLHAGYIGAYGNSWVRTPALDRLAWQSTVFDQMLIDSPCLERLYRSYWQGRHAMASDGEENQRSLPDILRESGVCTVLITDDPLVANQKSAEGFEEIVIIELPEHLKVVDEIEQTHFARCFVQIIDVLQRLQGPFFVWCHLGGLGTIWDAPLEFRHTYCDAGDPQPPDSAHVPDRFLQSDYDPDELLGISQSYAGQVSLLDTCLGALVDFFDEHFSVVEEKPLLAVTSARGFPLGEHLRVGPCDSALFSELVHVPLLVRMPDGSGAALRNQSLIEPADIWATLSEYFGVAREENSVTGRSLLPFLQEKLYSTLFRDRLGIIKTLDEVAIRTPAWFLRIVSGEEQTLQLFAKPDDRFEINDVASRCHDIVEGLQRALQEFQAAIAEGKTTKELPQLDDVLLNGLE